MDENWIKVINMVKMSVSRVLHNLPIPKIDSCKKMEHIYFVFSYVVKSLVQYDGISQGTHKLWIQKCVEYTEKLPKNPCWVFRAHTYLYWPKCNILPKYTQIFSYFINKITQWSNKMKMLFNVIIKFMRLFISIFHYKYYTN